MSAVAILITLLGSLVTSFAGSFLCFIIWVHFDLEDHWEARKDRRRVERGQKLDSAERVRHGLPPIPGDPAYSIPDEVEWLSSDGLVHLPALVAKAFGVSTGEARRALSQGGVRIDGSTVSPEKLDIPEIELGGKLLQLGKRRFKQVRIA